MTYLLAGVLLVAAVAILTLPWARRDPDDFTRAELGYAWRGPRGAVLGALRALVDADAVRLSRRRGVVRNDRSELSDLDPFTRAVYGGTGVPRGPGALRELGSVTQEMAPLAYRVVASRLRVGWLRRVVGSGAALAAPVVLFMANSIVLGIVASVVALWLLALRGTTIAGTRTLAAAAAKAPVPRGSDRPHGRVVHAILTGGAAAIPPWHATPGDSFGWGGDFGGDSGGGSDGGSDSGGY